MTTRSLQQTAGRLISLSDGKGYVIGAAPLTIGRGPDSDVPVHNEDVSRNHAYLLRTPQGFLLVDSSLHGTYVNGERVQAQRLLGDGDVVQIGARSFRLELRVFDSPLSGSTPSPVASPETSRHPRTIPHDALEPAQRFSWKERMKIWIKRVWFQSSDHWKQ